MILTVFTSCSKQQNKHLKEVDFLYEVCIDPSSNYSINEREKIPFKAPDNLNLGFYSGAIWFKIKIYNKSSSEKELVLKNNDVFNRNYRFYELDKETGVIIRENRNNDLTYNDDRSFNCPSPNFKVTLKPNQEHIFYQHITSEGRVVQVKPLLLTLNSFIQKMNQDTIENTLFYGVVIIVFLINFVYWRILKKRIYFYYTFYIFSSMSFYAGLEGNLFGLGIPNYLVDHWVFISLYSLIYSFLLFSKCFLKIDVLSIRFSRFLNYYTLLFLGILFYQFLFFRSSISNLHFFLNIVAISTVILTIIMIGISLKKKLKEAKFYIVALVCYLIFVFMGLLDSHFDVFSISYKNFFKIGFIIELIIFTYTVLAILAKGDNIRTELEAELQDSNKVRAETIKRLEELKVINNTLASTISQIKEEKIEKTDLLGIFKLLESNLSKEEDWLNFKEKFEEINPDFLPLLHKKHPELTKSEIRLLTLIKIGFTQKEIAKTLFIAEDSVKKAKSRLRKKLNLPRNVTLPAYLINV